MNFTNTIRLITTGFLALFLASCTEIIDVSTNDTASQLVVEANIALNEPAIVILTKSINLDEPNNFKRIKTAVVRITDNNGKTELLTFNSNGYFKTKILKGEIGKTYSLRIESEGKVVTSQCKIPNIVPIDSFSVVNSIFPGGGPPRANQPAPFYEITINYSDPLEQQNFYRIITYYNGKIEGRNSIFDDRFTNGKKTESNLIIYRDSAKIGDTIRVEMQCIDKLVYTFYQSMGSSNMGPGSSSSPANPYTNLNGAILGYFSAHTVERREYILKK